MKPLIAITTCHRYKGRADAQRATWVKNLKCIDYKFFLGKADRAPAADEVFLDVPDDYLGLPWKTRAIMKWALEHGYDAVFKCDDDTFVFPERLMNILPKSPYEGRVNRSNKELVPNGWCSGFAYWLAGDAIKIIANAPEPTNSHEDLWVGSILHSHNILPTKQPAFIVLSFISQSLWHHYKNQIIAACEFKDEEMKYFYQAMTDPNWVAPTYNTGINPNTGKRMMKFGEVLRRRT